MIQEIKTLEDLNDAKSKPASVVYFHTEDCGVCHVILPELEQIVTSEFPKMDIYVVNANSALEICASQSVFTFPTVLIFFEGKETLRIARNINLGQFRQSVGRLYNLMFN
ncbi:MAG: thioredoxin family protein [Bacteroidales bacterium]|nr:thioredoxin family protein [Bacteroidales bacterium]HPD95210.1 thioredoxin family protein [Tenuifilaceae bacterium]HRX31486.1 thioredoxin family protein [Tenuifilaceae bacterium]